MKIKRWTPDNPTNEYPPEFDAQLPVLGLLRPHDGSFVRLQNINIGYTIPVPQGLYSQHARVRQQNAYTFTKFDDLIEVGVDGIYWGGYPRLRGKYAIGLDLKF